MTDPPDPVELGALAVETAEAAAVVVAEGLGTDPRPETKSTPTDPVTKVDRATERYIVERLLAVRPHDSVLGEEGGERTGSSGVRWVIDPIDGTTNFVYGYGAFAVSIGAEIDGVVVAGAVHDVARDECFSAVKGHGAHGPVGPLQLAPAPPLPEALVATGFSYDSETRRRQAGMLVTVLPSIRDIRRGGSAALDLCWVGAGRVDAYFEQGLAPWDHAAGALVAAEAGARVSDLAGGPPSRQFVLAASPELHGQLARLLAQAEARAT